jgi:hypothetical protein
MGSILGGGGGGGGSGKAINTASTGVANAAQAGGNNTSNAINWASNASADAMMGGAQYAADQGLKGSQYAADQGLKGSQTSAAAQQQALDYLRQADQLPTGLRESALRSLGANYGIGYGADGSVTNTGGSITDRAMASPFYQAAVQQGENSVLRNASATGGLRSGSTSENLAQVNQNALLSAYNDQIAGLQGLSSLPSNANNIAGYMSGIGNTLGQGQANYGNIIGQGQINYGNTLGQGQAASAQARAQGQISAADALANGNNAAANALSQGQIAAAQSSAQGSQNSANNMMGLAGMGMQAFSMFSDRRLKSNIELTGEEKGVRKYKWMWNKLASRFGLRGKGSGVMADEVAKTHPEAVSMRDGFMLVDYSKLGVSYGV